MTRLPLVIVLVCALAALPLAGCLDRSNGGAVTPASEKPVLVTDVADQSAMTNASNGNAPHLHDYWGGKERLTVMQGQYPEQTFIFGPSWGFFLRPEPKKVVPQGASAVEVTISWTNGQTDSYGKVELWVKTAKDDHTRFIAEIAQGKPITIPTTNAMDDLPHNVLSAWTFELRVFPKMEPLPIMFDAQVSMLVVAIRGLEIPLFPAHPDFWKGATQLPLMNVEDELTYDGDSAGNYNCLGGCPFAHAPKDGALVPFDAKSVEVTLTQDAKLPTKLGLSYHGADSREWTRIKANEDSATKRVYRIPVTVANADGPYSLQSLWEFLPFIEDPQENSIWSGSYTIEARVLKNG